jgi:L-lactate utilization protein LutC
MVRHHYAQLAGDAGDARLAQEADVLAPRVRELSELLIDVRGVEDVGAAFPHRVTYHPSCHGARSLRVGDRPTRLLRAVRGLELIDLEHAEECCGFGGTFAVKNADTSAAILADKLRHIADTGAEVCVATDDSCLMQIGGAPAPPAGRCRHQAPRRGAGRHGMTTFPEAARAALDDAQLRHNLGRATSTIQAKRAAAVAEVPDWEELRNAGAAIKDHALATLPQQLERLEQRVMAAGGTVHWAPDADAANRIVTEVARGHGVEEVVKVKSLATDEIGLNEALASAGVRAIETDLAELIVQLAGDWPSHILVPAIHRNRSEIRALFERTIARGEPLGEAPSELAEVARRHLRFKFLSARMAVSGANFAVAETGAVCVVESEGNGRFCTTLPDVLVTVTGIEKVVPAWRDLEVMLQRLPRSSTGERMNPYTSIWTGVTAGDGPREFHLVLLDNGRTGRSSANPAFAPPPHAGDYHSADRPTRHDPARPEEVERVERPGLAELVQAPGRVGVDDPPGLTGGDEAREPRGRRRGRNPVDAGGHAGPDDAAVLGGDHLRGVRDDLGVEVGRRGQRRRSRRGRARHAVGAERAELLVVEVADVLGVEGRDDPAGHEVARRVDGNVEQRHQGAVDVLGGRLEVDVGQVAAARGEGLEVDRVVAGRDDVGRHPRPGRHGEDVAAVALGGGPRRGQLGDADPRAGDHRLGVELVGGAAELDRGALGGGRRRGDGHGERCEREGGEKAHLEIISSPPGRGQRLRGH